MQNYRFRLRAVLLVTLIATLTFTSTQLRADSGMCGGSTVILPFTDVAASPFFCQVAAAFFSGLTNGTSATTYSPSEPVTREQMAAFITRTMDQSIKRGSRRAALGQWWVATPNFDNNLRTTTIGCGADQGIASDGADIWLTIGRCGGGGLIARVRASDGRLLETWTGADLSADILVAMGRVFVVAITEPSGKLNMIDPTLPAGSVQTVSDSLGLHSRGIAFDGARIWTVNEGGRINDQDPLLPGSVSIVTPKQSLPWDVTTISTGFSNPVNIVYDGTNMWVMDSNSTIKKLDSQGSIIQTLALAGNGRKAVFDGTNLWVPTGGDTVTVIRASTGVVIATLTGNGLNNPGSAAFDGQRIIVTNNNGRGVSLWNASDLRPIGFFSTGEIVPFGACSDGVDFWISASGPLGGQLLRF